MAARFVRDEEVVGSNPATPTEHVQVVACPSGSMGRPRSLCKPTVSGMRTTWRQISAASRSADSIRSRSWTGARKLGAEPEPGQDATDEAGEGGDFAA